MTITEANAAQKVLEHLVATRHTLHRGTPKTVALVDAGLILARKSSKVLGAGMTESQFLEAIDKPVTR